ncbi:MAG: GIY-YIG nuclease family protein [Dehalococcoidia bacterium]
MSQPATIKIFLARGNPDALRTAEISNWTGKAIAAPRTELKELLDREELDRPGVYILVGTDQQSNEPALYIGEAESVAKRIRGHSERDFWSTAIAFVSKDDNLTKAHSKYLEGKLIEKATKAGRAILMNSVTSRSRLPESDSAEMDVFLDNIHQLLPVLGVSYFRTRQEQTATEKELLYCRIKGLVAKGKRSPTGFVVFKGSQAVAQHRPSATTIKIKREQLIAPGILKPEGNYLVFTKDFEFGSPSTAAGIIRGGNANGLDQWRNTEGKSLKELETTIPQDK